MKGSGGVEALNWRLALFSLMLQRLESWADCLILSLSNNKLFKTLETLLVKFF